jgi:glycosyltransferase involved in cell wall biosynthesis
VRDKGIVELVDAFDQILTSHPNVRLLLVGRHEAGDALPESCIRRINQHLQIIQTGFIPMSEIAPYYGAMNVLAFPTYREGFPNVVLQAASAELPVVAFRATGAVDAVEDGVTGTVVELGNAHALAEGLVRYLNDPELCQRHGRGGLARVLRDYQPEPIWAAMDAQFRQLIESRTR